MEGNIVVVHTSEFTIIETCCGHLGSRGFLTGQVFLIEIFLPVIVF